MDSYKSITRKSPVLHGHVIKASVAENTSRRRSASLSPKVTLPCPGICKIRVPVIARLVRSPPVMPRSLRLMLALTTSISLAIVVSEPGGMKTVRTAAVGGRDTTVGWLLVGWRAFARFVGWAALSPALALVLSFRARAKTQDSLTVALVAAAAGCCNEFRYTGPDKGHGFFGSYAFIAPRNLCPLEYILHSQQRLLDFGVNVGRGKRFSFLPQLPLRGTAHFLT